LRLGLTHT